MLIRFFQHITQLSAGFSKLLQNFPKVSGWLLLTIASHEIGYTALMSKITDAHYSAQDDQHIQTLVEKFKICLKQSRYSGVRLISFFEPR